MRFVAGLLASALVLTPVSACGTQQVPPAAARPRLVVVIAVDQMRADFLTRFPQMYHGGLARFIRDGAMYTNAHQDHSGTETSPGHATLGTGAFPSRHGIIANEWFERKEGKTIYSVDDTDTRMVGGSAATGRSPKRLMVDALGDWLKRSSRNSKVFSVALKDRGAILMGGKQPDGVFWYDDAGRYVTSTYYAKALPAWVDSFNLSQPAAKYLATGWSRLLPADAYSASTADSVPEEYDGVRVTFPHLLDDATTRGRPLLEIKWTPFADEITLQFARELATREKLGLDDTPDLLWISCSSGDYVGHRYGPFSQEAQDYYLRLDGYLADFFAFLDQAVGRERYTIALSGDHGALPLVEDLARRGEPAERVMDAEVNRVFSVAQAEVAQQLNLKGTLLAGYAEGWLLHYSEARSKRITPVALEGALADRFRQIPFVADVFTATEMRTGGGRGREYFDTFRHSYYEGRSADLILRYKEWFYVPAFSRFGTSHGSPYSYDTHVPLVIAGMGAVAGQHAERVATVDLAATLAKILGITPTGPIDGKVLTNGLAAGR